MQLVQLMKLVYENNRVYNILVPYVRWTFRRMLQRVDYVELENIPKDAAIIYSPNHVNTLLDALAILSSGKSPVVFAARADIFRKPTIARILNFLKILPIYRIRDGADSLLENDWTFRNAVLSLNAGLPFCIFPEGRHSQEPGLLPLRKGIARIAIKAAEDLDKPVVIVPVGLVYDDLKTFRTGLTIRFGQPIAVDDTEGLELADKAEESGKPAVTGQKRTRRLLLKLEEKMRPLQEWKQSHTRHPVILRSILIAPFALIAGLFLLPAFGLTTFFDKKISDKAFLNSIRYVACYLINPIIWLIISLLLLIIVAFGVFPLPLWASLLLIFAPVPMALLAPAIWYGVVR